LLALLRRLRRPTHDVTPAHEKAAIRQRLGAAQREAERLERLAREYRELDQGLR
jgi:hypothetical protein